MTNEAADDATVTVTTDGMTAETGTFSLAQNAGLNGVTNEAADDATVTVTTDGMTAESGTFSLAKNASLNGVENTADDDAAVTVADGAITVDGATVDYTFTPEGASATTTYNLKNAAATLSSTGVSNLTAGTVSATGAVTIGSDTFTSSDAKKTIEVGVAGEGQLGVVNGTIAAESGSTSYGADGADELKDTVTVAGGTDTDGATVVFAKGVATVTNLDAGETVTITRDGKTTTFTATTAGDDAIVTVTKESDGSNSVYTLDADGAYTFDGATGLTTYGGKDIHVANVTATTSYDTYGVEIPEGATTTPAVTVTVDETTKAKTVAVSGNFYKNIYLDEAATVTDSTGATNFIIGSAGTNKVSGAGFSVDKSGVISDASGTVKALKGTTALTLSGSVNVNVTDAKDTAKLTYKAGADLTNTTITAGTNSVTLTEADDGKDTVIDVKNMAVTGVNGEATVRTSGIAAATLKTTGEGTFTLNGKAYKVEGDSDGVTFAIAGTQDTLATIEGLASGATVSVASSLSDANLTVNEMAYTGITATGALFTATNAEGKGTVTLFNQGDKVTYGGNTYEITTLGSGDINGIVIGDTSSLTNRITSLSDGDVVTVTTATGKSTYEVTGNVLTAKQYNAEGRLGKTTVYTLNTDELDGFSINTAAGDWKVENGTEGDAISGDGVTFGSSSNPATVTSLTDGLYIGSNGETSASSDKAVAQITINDETGVAYTALSEKAQTVKVNNDTANKDNWTIQTRGGKDTIEFNNGGNNMAADATIASGAGADTITAGTTSTANDLFVDAGDGKDTVNVFGAGNTTVNAGTGNDTITASGTGEYLINLDSGNNKVEHTGTSGNATIVGGSGNDTIKALADDVVSGGDGADTFDVSQSSMTINDYTYGTDVLQAASVAGAITVTPTNFGGDGVVSIASGVTADVSRGTGTGDFYAVSLVDSNGKNKKNVAWAKEGGSTINVTTYDQAVTLIGNADGKSALYAGTKADTIYSYADSDSVYGGAGKDAISLATVASGRVVGVATTSGKDTVDGFTASFEEGDSIYMVDGAASDVKASFSNNTVTFKDGEGSLQLNNVATSSTGAVELNVSGAKVALAAASVGGAIAADSTSYANFYMGNKAAVSFAAAEGEVNVDLRNGLDSGAEGAKFSGIIAVAGGAGQNTLIGGTAGETLTAGTGDTSLWGGAGKDTLVGNGASDVFYIGTGDGSDVVLNFSAAGNENEDTVYALNDITSAKLTSDGVKVSVSDRDKLTLRNVTADTAIKFNSNGSAGVAKVGSATNANNFTYDSTVTYYGGGSKSDKIAFASGSTENAEIWMDGSQGKSYASIDVVDGTNTSGSLIVAGDSSSQTLIGGKGDTSLWGGAGKDTLVGNGASDVFYIGTGDGSDVVLNFSAAGNENADTVYALNDITGAKLTSNDVEVSVGDTDKLTLKNVTADTAIKFNSNGNAGVAKVGSATNANNFSYDSTVTYYGGGSKSDKIAFASGYTDNAEIWLDGSQGKSYASIDVVDGANTSGNLLVAGDSSSQSIIGGKGDTSLWGGAGSATDTLRSSSGSQTMFWWGAGEGNDVFVSASADDSVNLYNLKLSDVDGANSSITNSGVVLALNDGSKLTVQTSRDMTFSIDGQSWTAQHSSNEWKQNS